VQRGELRLIEQREGVGELLKGGVLLRQVQYRFSRYQGMLEGSGMPVPGLHRIEGSVDFPLADEQAHLLGAELTLRLEDGRSLNVTLADRQGRILDVGHGPGGGCRCC
jgi:hypothetical protein